MAYVLFFNHGSHGNHGSFCNGFCSVGDFTWMNRMDRIAFWVAFVLLGDLNRMMGDRMIFLMFCFGRMCHPPSHFVLWRAGGCTVAHGCFCDDFCSVAFRFLLSFSPFVHQSPSLWRAIVVASASVFLRMYMRLVRCWRGGRLCLGW